MTRRRGRVTDAGLEGVQDNITVSKAGRRAWFTLDPQRVTFRSAEEIEAIIEAHSAGLAGLVGREWHERTTSVPWREDEWARALHADVQRPLPGWGGYLADEQEHVNQLNLAPKLTMVGVDVAASPHRTEAYRQDVEAVGNALSGVIGGRPSTPAELQFLTARSHTLGAPAPLELPDARTVWDGTDLAVFEDMARWTADVSDTYLTVVSHVDGRKYTRYVSVLTLEGFDTVDIPGGMGPWMHLADRLPFPVEWSRITRMPDQGQVAAGLTLTLQKIASQCAHWAEEHGIPVPSRLSDQDAGVQEIAAEVASGRPGGARVESWVRAAVGAPTLGELRTRVDAFKRLYGPRLVFEARLSQYHRALEFIPGASLADEAHKRRMSLNKYSAGLPTATARVGDPYGFHLGRTAGTSRQAALWAPWRAMEALNHSGLALAHGELGTGKSTLLGALIYHSTMAGVPGMVFDPGGPLARLAGVPSIRGVSRAVNLMDAEPGALSPFRVVAEPRRDNYGTEQEWRAGCAAAGSLRMELCADILAGLLPANVAGAMFTQFALADAVRRVGGHWASDASQVIARLRDIARPDTRALKGTVGGDSDTAGYRLHASHVAQLLENVAALPQCRLIFGRPSVAAGQSFGADGALLTVLTMRGNVLPKDGRARSEWTSSERVGHTLHALASFYASQWMYSMPMSARKLLVVDEAQVVAEIDSGRALLRSVGHDCRKWDTRLVLASPEPSLAAECGVEERVGAVFVGRLKSDAGVDAALGLLGVPRGVGYEKRVRGLPNQQFAWRDGEGGCEVVKVHRPGALAVALDTTPGEKPAVSHVLAAV